MTRIFHLADTDPFGLGYEAFWTDSTNIDLCAMIERLYSFFIRVDEHTFGDVTFCHIFHRHFLGTRDTFYFVGGSWMSALINNKVSRKQAYKPKRKHIKDHGQAVT